MIILIHGPAELLRSEELARIRASIATDPGLAELNTAVLDGRQVTLGDLQFACGAVPFLAERRLVVVERLLGRLAAGGKGHGKAGAQSVAAAAASEAGEVPSGSAEAAGALARGFLALLEELPETTDLVLVEEDTVSSGATWRRLVELQRAGHARMAACEKPRRGDLPDWIRARARMHGVQIDRAAVNDLADFVGDNLRLLDQEILKLRDYAAGGHVVNQVAVRQLVPATRAANVFEMVDALAAGHTAQAGRLLRHALEVDGEEPLGLLALFGRRYRQLIQVKALQSTGARPEEIGHQLGIADWQAKRLLDQARHQAPARLLWALEHVLAADESIKVGRCTDREAMDILLAQLSGDAKR